jgi:dolichol-phosphate mannosyltransferase
MHSLAIIPVYREPEKAGAVLKRFEPGLVDEICVVVDNPDERMATEIRNALNEVEVPVSIINNPERKGIGHAIRQGYRYALDHGFDLIVVMAGNGKDDPKEIPRITNPILNMGYDYVQGSRFLPGGRRERNPLFRRIFTRAFPYFWTLLSGVHCTDVTNGFRAYKSKILIDPRIDIWQTWLDGYELEYYLHYKALTLGYKFTERPVSKTYPPKKKGGKYTHISPLRDWWQIVGPLLLLKIGARK